jgi:hypothetical protein
MLNYNGLDAMAAVQLLRDRNNPLRLPEAVLVEHPLYIMLDEHRLYIITTWHS